MLFRSMDKEIPISERRKEQGKRIFKYGGISLCIIVALVLFFNFMKTSVNYDNLVISTIDKGTIEVAINASGKVVPLTEEIITTPISSKILEVYKNPGDKVLKGEAILLLELSSIETEYQQKLDEREMKKSKLMQFGVNSSGKISEMKMQEKIKEMQLKQIRRDRKSTRLNSSH